MNYEGVCRTALATPGLLNIQLYSPFKKPAQLKCCFDLSKIYTKQNVLLCLVVLCLLVRCVEVLSDKEIVHHEGAQVLVTHRDQVRMNLSPGLNAGLNCPQIEYSAGLKCQL